MDEDRLEAARDRVGRRSREGSEAGVKVMLERLLLERRRESPGILEVIWDVMPERESAATWRRLLDRELVLKSLSLRNPVS